MSDDLVSGVLSTMFDAIVDNTEDLENHGYWQVHTWLENLQLPAEASEVFDEGANQVIDAPNQAVWWQLADPLECRYKPPADALIDLAPLVAVYEDAVRAYGRVGQLKALAACRNCVSDAEEAYDEERSTYEDEKAEYEDDLAAWEDEHGAWLSDPDRDEANEPDRPDPPDEPDFALIEGHRWAYAAVMAAFSATAEDLEDY